MSLHARGPLAAVLVHLGSSILLHWAPLSLFEGRSWDEAVPASPAATHRASTAPFSQAADMLRESEEVRVASPANKVRA